MRAGDFGCHRPATRWRQNDDNRNHAGKIRSARRRFFGLANGVHFSPQAGELADHPLGAGVEEGGEGRAEGGGEGLGGGHAGHLAGVGGRGGAVELGGGGGEELDEVEVGGQVREPGAEGGGGVVGAGEAGEVDEQADGGADAGVALGVLEGGEDGAEDHRGDLGGVGAEADGPHDLAVGLGVGEARLLDVSHRSGLLGALRYCSGVQSCRLDPGPGGVAMSVAGDSQK